MYTLEDMRNFPEWPKNTFSINYDVDLNGDNHEWRECVNRIIQVLKNYYQIEIISEPTFEPYEDFAELSYSLNQEEIIIGNDFLFSMIWIEAKTVELALEIQKILAEEENLQLKRVTDETSNKINPSNDKIKTETFNQTLTIQTNTQQNKNIMLNNQIKEAGTWKWGILCLVLLAPFFFLTYGFANHYASGLANVPSIVFEWEKHIPLWAWTIVPYWSIDLFYGLSLLLCWNKFELKQQALRLLLAQIICISCFLLFPLKFSFERPPLDGFFGLWFDALMGFDKPFNQAPSLHIVLLVILWDFYRRHVNENWKYLVDFWCLLIAISVLTTWQHHFIDIPTGIIVGAFCLWLFPVTVKSPIHKDRLQAITTKHIKLGSYYLCGAIVCAILAYELRPWGLWFLYPTVSLFLVALAYCFACSHFFQKQNNGDMTPAAKILFTPYFIFAWLNSRIWTKKHSQDSLILSTKQKNIYIGRIPTIQHSRNYQAIFDCVAELPLQHQTQYQQYLSLDLIPLQAEQLKQAVHKLNCLFELLNLNQPQQVLICCALGYSRSSAVLAAWLIEQNHVDTVEDAINIIQQARPWIVIKQVQVEEIQIYQLKLRGLAP